MYKANSMMQILAKNGVEMIFNCSVRVGNFPFIQEINFLFIFILGVQLGNFHYQKRRNKQISLYVESPIRLLWFLLGSDTYQGLEVKAQHFCFLAFQLPKHPITNCATAAH